MKKRRILACAVLIACLSMGAYGSFAYFTADATATNVITAGNIKIELKETAIPEDGGDPVPFEDQTGVMPGQVISKIVQIENTGGQSAYIRVKVEKEISLAEGVNGDPDLSLVICKFNTGKWEEKDGYYYYKEALQAGETTEPLFTEVVFDKTMDNMYQDSKAEIRVYAQATQTANNGTSAMEASGWPKEDNE